MLSVGLCSVAHELLGQNIFKLNQYTEKHKWKDLQSLRIVYEKMEKFKNKLISCDQRACMIVLFRQSDRMEFMERGLITFWKMYKLVI